MTNSRKLLIPALKAKMGDNIYYISYLSMKEIASRISIAEEIHKNKKLGELIQRQVTNRSSGIASYLRTQPQRFFNALILGVYGGAPHWYEVSIGKSELLDLDELPISAQGALGILSLNGDEKLFAIDGQHRVAGIKEALAGKHNTKLNDEEVCTIFLSADVTKPLGLERTRRLFSTLNRYAKPVDMMDIIALDEDDAIAIVTRRLMEEHPLFKDYRISMTKGKSIPVTDNKCFTNITAFYEVNDIILANESNSAWKNFKRSRPSNSKLMRLYKQSIRFWDSMVHYFPPLAEVQDSTGQKGISGKYRHRNGGHILFRTVGLLSMARAIKIATSTGGSQESWIQKFSKVQTDLASEPWPGLLWNPNEKTMIVRKENQNTATSLLLYMIDIDLKVNKTNEKRLKERYASLLNRSVEEVKLPRKLI